MAKPVQTFRRGSVSIAVFEKELTKNGKTFTSTSFAIQTSYKDKDGKWQNSSFFKVTDLPKLLLALMDAMNYAYGKKDEVEVDTGDKTNDIHW